MYGQTIAGLGLIMGTRMYYPFHDGEQLDDAAFESRIDAVVRELGDRGKRKAHSSRRPKPRPALGPAEGIPPPVTTAVAPAPAPVLAPAPAPAAPLGGSMDLATTPVRPAVAAAATATPDFNIGGSPTMAITPVARTHGSDTLVTAGGGGAGVSLAELSHFIKEQRDHDAELKREARAEISELKADMLLNIERLRAELSPSPPQLVTEEQLIARTYLLYCHHRLHSLCR